MHGRTPCLTGDQVRACDQFTIEQHQVSSIALMERAGHGAAEWIREFVLSSPQKQTVIILCGPGNNGGDGVVVARRLQAAGVLVDVAVIAGEKTRFSHDLQEQISRFEKQGGQIHYLVDATSLQRWQQHTNARSFIIVDGLFGTGLTRPLEGIFAQTAQWISESDAVVISLDVPSGICANTGEIVGGKEEGRAVVADITLTFGFFKQGLYLGSARDHVGDVHLIDIGLHTPPEVQQQADCTLLKKEDVAALLHPRRRCQHKGSFGHTLVVAGNEQTSGACALATLGAMSAGSGLVSVVTSKRVEKLIQSAVLEAMILSLANDPWEGNATWTRDHDQFLIDTLATKTAVAIGCGLGRHQNAQRVLETVIKNAKGPLVVDADALSLLAQQPSLISKAKQAIILTPHPGEMARLLDWSTEEVEANRLKAVRHARERFGTTVVLKGANTVIASQQGGLWINTTGHAAMASGGAGDVLAGILAGLLAQGLEPEAAACAGVFLHGLAGEDLARNASLGGFQARSLAQRLPQIKHRVYVESHG